MSGAMFPLSGASGWLAWVMRANPLTYGVEALRGLLFPASPTLTSLPVAMMALGVFAAVMFGLSFFMVNRRTTRPAA